MKKYYFKIVGVVGAILIGVFTQHLYDVTHLFYNEGPNVTWNVTPTSGDYPLTVNAGVVASDPDGDVLIISWYLNGNEVNSSDNTSHQFQFDTQGDYDIRAIISDGRADPIEKQTTVSVTKADRKVQMVSNLVLNQEYILNVPNKDVLLPTTIVTNGYPLRIEAHTIQGRGVIIRSFSSIKAKNGKNGVSGSDGQQGSDRDAQAGDQGSSGGYGEHGSEGAVGSSGLDAGPVEIIAVEISTALTIDNIGQGGGDGGTGGNGGHGGRGGGGQDASHGEGDRGEDVCFGYAGSGRTGGNGGNGGDGGDAGKGGAGGSVRIEAETMHSKLFVKTSGGLSGSPGAAGNKGDGGAGGPPGLTSIVCTSPNIVGLSGIPGIVGNSGDSAENGAMGSMVVRVNGSEWVPNSGHLTLE